MRDPLAETGREASGSHGEQRHSAQNLQVPRTAPAALQQPATSPRQQLHAGHSQGLSPRGGVGAPEAEPWLQVSSRAVAKACALSFLQEPLPSPSPRPMLSHDNRDKTAVLLFLSILGIVLPTLKLQGLKVLPGVLTPAARGHSQVQRGGGHCTRQVHLAPPPPPPAAADQRDAGQVPAVCIVTAVTSATRGGVWFTDHRASLVRRTLSSWTAEPAAAANLSHISQCLAGWKCPENGVGEGANGSVGMRHGLRLWGREVPQRLPEGAWEEKAGPPPAGLPITPPPSWSLGNQASPSNSCYGGRLPDTPTMKRQLPTSPRECWKESGFISRPGHERTWVFRTGVVAR